MISFHFVLNFSGKKSLSWMCSKLLCFYFKGLPFFFYLFIFISEGKALEVLCRIHLSAGAGGQPSCVTKGALSLFPTPWGPYGTTVSAFLPHLWEAEPCLAEPHFTASRVKANGQNYVLPTYSLCFCTWLYQHCLPGLKLVDEEKFVLLSPYTSFSIFQD